MWTVSSHVRIQRRHWQPLSVHLWAYSTHPTHHVNDHNVMSEGWPPHRGLRNLLFSNSGVASFTSQKNQISVSAVRRVQRVFTVCPVHSRYCQLFPISCKTDSWISSGIYSRSIYGHGPWECRRRIATCITCKRYIQPFIYYLILWRLGELRLVCIKKWRESWIRGQQTCPLTIHFNMWTVRSHVSIQRRHWQPLSVHFWVYSTHPPMTWMIMMWWVKVVHYTGVYVPYSFRTVVWVLLRPRRIR